MLSYMICLLLGLQSGQSAREGKPVLDFAVDVHRENLKKLNRGVVRFELLQGTARTVEDVAEGRLGKPIISSGKYAFEGKDAVYECLTSEQELKDSTVAISETESRSSVISNRLLTDGKVTCLDLLLVENGKVVHRPLIEPDQQAALFNGNFQFVYWMGEAASRGSRLVEDREGVKDGSRVLAESRLNDDGTATVAFSVGKTLRRYRIDLQRGAIPMSIVDLDAKGSPLLEVHYRDIKKLENGAWLPMTKVVFNSGAQTGRRFKIIDCDIPSHVPKEKFFLDFAEPIQVLDRSTKSYLKDVSKLNLQDRGRSKSAPFMVAAATSMNVVPMPELSGVREPTGWWTIALIVSGSALAGALLYVVRRKTARRAAG